MFKFRARGLIGGLLTLTMALGAQIAAPAVLPSSSVSSAAADDLLPGLVPQLTLVTPSPNSFTGKITNFDPAYTFVVTATVGSVNFRAQKNLDGSASISIFGLAYGTSSTITVTSSRAGYTTERASITGSSATAPLVPLFSAPTPIPYGFTVQVANYDTAFSWDVHPTVGQASISSAGLITVSNIQGSSTSDVLVYARRSGYVDGFATATGTSMTIQPGLVPEIGEWVRSASTLSAQITNFDSSYEWVIDTQGQGTASISYYGLIQVTGLQPGTQFDVTITASRYGYTTENQIYTLSSRWSALIPTFGEATPTADGFIVDVSNFDGNFDWVSNIDFGDSSFDNGRVTVTGLGPGQSATLTVGNSRTDFESGEAGITTSAIQGTFTPTLDSAISTRGGFIVQVTNFDTHFDWYVATDTGVGQATIDDSGLITVTGLSANQTATLVISTARNGYVDGQATIDGTSLDPPTVEPTPNPSPNAGYDSSQEASRAAAEAEARAIADALLKAKAEAKAEAEAKVAAAAAAKLAADLKAISSIAAAPSSVTGSKIKSLTSAQVALIPVSTFRRLSSAAIGEITPKQAAGLGVFQVKSLGIGSLIKLSPAAIGSLKPEALGALSIGKLKALTKAQVMAIWAAQLLELDADQRKSLKRR